jgi:hypothetical protein
VGRETVAAVVNDDGSRPEFRLPLRAVDLLERAWLIYRAQLSTCLSLFWGVVVVQWLLMIVLVSILAELSDSFRDPNFTQVCNFIRFLGAIVIPAWLTVGQIKFTLALVRQQPTSVEQVFSGAAYVLTILLAAIPVLVLVVLPSYAAFELGNAVLQAPDGMTFRSVAVALSGLGGGLVLSLYLLARLGQFHYLITDRAAGVARAIIESYQLTRGRAVTLMAVYILLAGINLVGFVSMVVGAVLMAPSVGLNEVVTLPFVIPLIFTLPFTSLAAAVVYDSLGPETLPAYEELSGDLADSEG